MKVLVYNRINSGIPISTKIFVQGSINNTSGIYDYQGEG